MKIKALHSWLERKLRKHCFIQQHIVILNNTVFSFHFAELRSSSCGNPGVPPKGILNGTQFNVGDKIRYRCVTGYVLDGHSLLTCVTNAASVSVWDFPVPICRGEDDLRFLLTACDDCCCQLFLPAAQCDWRVSENTWCYLVHILGFP